VNADGLADLFVVKGNVAEMPDFAIADPNNLLLQRPDGTFTEAGDQAGLASTAIGRGGAVVDLNLDGILDVIVQNRWSGPEVWRGLGPVGQAVQVRLEQPGANRDAIGAFVTWRSTAGLQTREITIGGGHAGGQLGWWHLGLGDLAMAEVQVTWPDGTVGPWQTVPAGGFAVLRPDLDPEPWTPGP
jgi:enediyne biosynthesis protein E4